MSLITDDNRQYYTDGEVEDRFRLSSSKMRTAQRVGISESASTLQGGRYIRVWDETEVLKAFLAHEVSESLSVPFQASCSIIEAVAEIHPDAQKIGFMLIGRESPEIFGGKGLVPIIKIYERREIYTRFHDKRRFVGEIGHGEDGRATLEKATEGRLNPEDRDPPENPKSHCYIDLVPVIVDFMDRQDSA